MIVNRFKMYIVLMYILYILVVVYIVEINLEILKNLVSLYCQFLLLLHFTKIKNKLHKEIPALDLRKAFP